ncbi:hypothetical protein ABGB17_21265 [Sphaerisporangium sp. B11E5]|uniref:hypothetical protein n=1 Tax=Sphaerisporangium sp. B11E5 TaxID=3153563 RepID=UPI00325D07DC
MSAHTDAGLTRLVREHLGDPAAEIAEQRVEPVEAEPGAFSTASLHRVRGTTTDGAAWSFFVKSVNSVRHSPALATLPEHLRPVMIEHFPWRSDADVYLAAEPLPRGLRLPRLYRLDDLGDDRLIMWLEDVEQDPGAQWDLDRYARAAHLLGALAAARPVPRPDPPRPLNTGLRFFYEDVVPATIKPRLLGEELWRHPLVAPYADGRLRQDVRTLIGRCADLLDALDRLPHTQVHGDACPQNLLVPADGSADFVAVDWSFNDPAAVGHDLGQLLMGHAHLGRTPVEELPKLQETIERSYREAFPAADPAQITFGFLGGLVLRSLWTAVPIPRLAEDPTPDLHEHFRNRLTLTRHLTDLGLSLTF